MSGQHHNNPRSLKSRIFSGGILLTFGSGSEFSLRFLRNVILTRLLVPEAFGMMAIVLAVTMAFESFTEVGIKEAIIQSPHGSEREYLNGAFAFSLVRAAGLYLMGFAFAPYLADFYGNPELTLMLRVTFLSVLFNGAMSVGAYISLKEMKFFHWLVVWHGGSAIGLLTALGLAFPLRTVWVLVIGFTTEAASRFLLSYVVCPYVPGLRFDRDYLRALFKYARGMAGLPILTFIFLQTDIFVAGKLMPAYALGLYSMSSGLARMPFKFISSVFNRIILPAFSEVQRETERINGSVIMITSILAFAGFPTFALLLLYGKELLGLIFGAPYSAMAIPFAAIFLSELLRMSGVPLAAVYLSIGRPELHRAFTGLRAAVLVALIYPAISYFGFVGAAGAMVLAMICGSVLQVQRMKRLTGLNLLVYWMIFVKALTISAIPVVLWMLTRWFGFTGLSGHFLPGLVGVLLSYALGFSFFRKSGMLEVIRRN